MYIYYPNSKLPGILEDNYFRSPCLAALYTELIQSHAFPL